MSAFRRRLIMLASSYKIDWATQTGTWTASTSISDGPSEVSPVDGKYYTCTSPGTTGSTRVRCTFSGVSSITFHCISHGESSYDYLTIGNLDSTCSRSSYKYSLRNHQNTWESYTYTISDSGTHYVEFCYSKDSSVDNDPDNAIVFVSAIEK